MKRILFALTLSATLLAGNPAKADVFGDADDQYIGLQLSIPLGAKRISPFSSKAEFSALLVEQSGGIRQGIAFTQDASGIQSMSYLRPSREFKIGQGRISDYAVPVISLTEGKNINGAEIAGGAAQLLFVVAVGTIVVIKLAEQVAEDIVDCINHEDDACETEAE